MGTRRVNWGATRTLILKPYDAYLPRFEIPSFGLTTPASQTRRHQAVPVGKQYVI